MFSLDASKPAEMFAGERMSDPSAELVADIVRRAQGFDARGLLALVIPLFPGRICAVSSFGAESAVTLALIAEVAPAMPVLFLDTNKLFPETLAYRDALIERLGLTDLRNLQPDPGMVEAADPAGDLWRRDPDDCCLLRKVLPLEDALSGFSAWINGRKRYHGNRRASLPRIELVDGRMKLNPLADWTPEMVRTAFLERDLPRHPLAARGYPSIGCAPCTRPSRAGENVRAGRWMGHSKTECGIHR
jgi:phosphoadenosine phosphosulfate reductase